ncbi:putative TIR domain, winged helix-turn-helix DNA-binding domain-containing protein [Medicago truncatula]|uniref:Putative TIR domain, winged helix-turn-helix DNA-binding domain-containing protein n=1 Tax=Medicago truncatula TaxID=3880 RepID=A0A396HG89_MEDTR|nr:putative TIR domain, winged helix-turn-helix DNA-binding domain-containing protein [Medicago truncatula]
MAMQSTSSSVSYDFKYQVFLSFRGADTRYEFTGNLYKALTDKGIHTFFDDRELQRGDKIEQSLNNAIEESRIFIPVFSANYASSSFCLDELVHIIRVYKEKGRLVLPVFYGVDPGDIRHQRGSYAIHLTKHEKRFGNNKENMEKLLQWKKALKQAADLSGFHFSLGNGYEYKRIGEIIRNVTNQINRVSLHVAKYPVGLQSRVQQVKSLLDNESDDVVHMVGLYGIGGLGKSTLAKATFNSIADKFEVFCFLENVRENSAKHGLENLQEQLLLKTIGEEIKLGGVSQGIQIIKDRLRRKKVLLILDDIDKLEQLDALAGGFDWFGNGSRVIITTRDKQLLTNHEIELMYEVEGLYGTEALELLRWMAFKNNKVPSSYEHILNRAVSYASGLPLVLEIVGSNLFGKSIQIWKGALDGYERIPDKKIQEILRVSYDALEEEQQSVFLDIACCFKEHSWEEFEDILRTHYGHCIKHHVQVLAEKSLIVISRSKWGYIYVTLHDLIKDMGKEVVRQQSSKEPGERSRLWCHNDIIHVLQGNTGTSKVEMLYMNFPSKKTVIDWNGKAFMKMTNLKTLIIKKGHFSKGPEYLPSSLRVLKWDRYPSDSLSSSILNKKFENMKVFSLDKCQHLTHIPDVSCLPILEKFSFKKCRNLITIDISIGYLDKLEILNAENCSKLESFPPLRLPSLKDLKLSGCKSLKSFPKLLCEMTKIKGICLYDTSIGELPSSFRNLNELHYLQIFGDGKLKISSNIFAMPNKINSISASGCNLLLPKDNDKMNSEMFSNVKCLRLSNNLSDGCLPIFLKWCVNVTSLDLSGNKFKIIPECLSELHLIVDLSLDFCEYLEEIRGIPPNLYNFSAIGCESLSLSSIRMLLSQKRHEAGRCTKICLLNKSEGIPDRFEHQSRGDTISFWFRKKIPSIRSIILLRDNPLENPRVKVFVNGYYDNLIANHFNSFIFLVNLRLNHTYLFDLKLEEIVELSSRFMFELDEALSKNEWIHIELQIGRCLSFIDSPEIGIHVLKEKRSMEEDVIFTNPYSRKRKLDMYLNPYSRKRKLDEYLNNSPSPQYYIVIGEYVDPSGLEQMASLLARLLTVPFVPLYFSFCLLVFSFLIQKCYL